MTDQSLFEIAPLDRDRHDRAAFVCGKEVLDRYLQQQASQDVKRLAAAVFIATRRGESPVVGYYTLSQASVQLDALSPPQQKRRARFGEVSITLLGRLAVHAEVHGSGLGTVLLGDACRRAAAIADEVAAVGMLVDAIDDDAGRFYEKFGFTAFPESPRRLFLPMKTIQNYP